MDNSKLKAAILQVDKILTLSEEKIKTLRALRVSLLMKLYPDLDWQRDRYDTYNRPCWGRFTAMIAARKFSNEQATAPKV